MVAVITINYNKSNFTKDCVNSILSAVYSNFRIVLVDNGSEVSDYEKLLSLKDERIIITRLEENIVYVGGVNHGLKEAEKLNPSYFLIMNNDTILDSFAIQELVDTARRYQDNCIVSGKTYNMDEPDTLQYIGNWCRNFNKLEFPSYIFLSREKDVGQYDTEMIMEMLDDIFWLVPSEVFKKIGYYSEYFYIYGEQNDYALRAKKNDVLLVYTPKAKIWHYCHLTTSEGSNGFQKIYYWQGYGFLLLAYLHLTKKSFLKLYISRILKYLFKSGISLLFLNYSKFRQKYQPYLLAHTFFTIWLFNKKPNNGFNPYIK